MSGSSQVCGYDNNKYDDDNNDFRVATIRDGWILVVPFPDDAKMATFQGRKSEFGNGMHDMPEPKLSWEYCWCQCNAARRHVQCNANNIDDNLDNNEDDNNGGGGGVWDLLPTWTEGLQGVATLVMSLLGIPQTVALSNGKCCCWDDDDRY